MPKPVDRETSAILHRSLMASTEMVDPGRLETIRKPPPKTRKRIEGECKPGAYNHHHGALIAVCHAAAIRADMEADDD